MHKGIWCPFGTKPLCLKYLCLFVSLCLCLCLSVSLSLSSTLSVCYPVCLSVSLCLCLPLSLLHPLPPFLFLFAAPPPPPPLSLLLNLLFSELFWDSPASVEALWMAVWYIQVEWRLMGIYICMAALFQLEEWLASNCTLPLPPAEGEDTFFEYVVGETGEWEHWTTRVSH